MMKLGDFERVHTMTDYYDGPRRGIADFDGGPHLYESQWIESDAGLDVFALSPVGPELLPLALEDWAIWLRWERAFHLGRATRESHPALPVPRPRQEELEVILQDPQIDPTQEVRALGEFRSVRSGPARRGWPPLEVRWTRLRFRHPR